MKICWCLLTTRFALSLSLSIYIYIYIYIYIIKYIKNLQINCLGHGAAIIITDHTLLTQVSPKTPRVSYQTATSISIPNRCCRCCCCCCCCCCGCCRRCCCYWCRIAHVAISRVCLLTTGWATIRWHGRVPRRLGRRARHTCLTWFDIGESITKDKMPLDLPASTKISVSLVSHWWCQLQQSSITHSPPPRHISLRSP